MFSEPVISGTVIGQLLPSVAAELGLKNSVIVVAGGHDQPMAALGAGVVKKGQSVDGMGSAECITLALDRQDITKQMYANNYCCEPYVFEDKFVTLAFNASSGTAIKWYRDAIESERSAEYAKTGRSFYDDVLEKECARQTSGVYFLPYVAGLRNAVFGQHDRRRFYRYKILHQEAEPVQGGSGKRVLRDEAQY